MANLSVKTACLTESSLVRGVLKEPLDHQCTSLLSAWCTLCTPRYGFAGGRIQETVTI